MNQNQKPKTEKKIQISTQKKQQKELNQTLGSSIVGDDQNKTLNLNTSVDGNDENNQQSNIDNKWCELKILGKNISRRRNHTAIINDGLYKSFIFYLQKHLHQNFKSMYIYGGYEVNVGILDDFYCMEIQDAEVYRWQIIHSGEKPEIYPGKRAKHSAVVFNNEMYIFGGLKHTLVNTNEMFAFNFDTSEWRLINQNGQTPPQIDSHSYSLDEGSSQMIIFGGFQNQKNGGYSNQVYAFNFTTLTWKLLEIAQNSPCPPQRLSASICTLNNQMYMFGGTNVDKKFDDFWKFDLKQQTWNQIQINGSIPQSRNGHSLINYLGVIILFGGIHDITHEKNDMLLFNIQKSEWQVIDCDTSHYKDEYNDMPYSPPSQKQNDGDNKGLTQTNNFNIQPDVYNTKHHNKRQYVPFKKLDETNRFQQQTQTKLAKIPSITLIEENRQKRNQLKKNNLLQEFELKDEEEEQKYRPSSPTTEGLKNKIMSIGNPLKKKKYMQQYQDSTKYANKQNYNYKANRIIGHRPCARDGHSAAIFENQFLIFGGDRHLMAYNDLFMVDLEDITGIKAPQQPKRQKRLTNYQLNDEELQNQENQDLGQSQNQNQEKEQ